MSRTELSDGTDKTKEKNHIDFLKVCRTCLRTTSGSQCLIDESMIEMIQASTGVMIKKEDELPQQICTVCFRAMQFAYAFRQECQQADTILKTYIDEQKTLSKAVSIDKVVEVVRFHDESEKLKRCSDVDQHIKVKHSVMTTPRKNNHIKRRTCFVRLVRFKNILSRGGPENIPKRANTPSTNVELVRGIVKEPTDFDKEALHSPPENCESLAESEPLTVQPPGQQRIYFFSCTLCDWKCELYREIIDHYVMNHVRGLPPFKCPLCDDILIQRNPLRCHLRTHIVQEYKCQYCDTQYKDAFMMRRHLLRHTGETFSCILCSKSFKHIGALRAHIRRKIENNDLRHRDYLKGFSDLYSRRGNTVLLDRQPLVTNEPLDDENFAQVHSVTPTERPKPHDPPQHDEHISDELLKVHSSPLIEQQAPQALTAKQGFVEEPYKVDKQCFIPVNDEHFAEEVRELNSSPPTHELPQISPTKCEFVEDEFANEENCELLEVFHEPLSNTPKLSHSPKASTGLSKESHNATPKLQVSEKKIGHFFACALCSLKFEMYRNIISHYVVEHASGTSPFHCPLCKNEFTEKIVLRRHIRSHVAQVYNCRYCGTGYKNAFMLRRHLLYHTGERPYTCTYCNKGFKQRRELTVHVQAHAKNREYKCEECHKDFCTLYRFRLHRERHKDVSLRCFRCNKGFMTKLKLWRHIARMCEGDY